MLWNFDDARFARVELALNMAGRLILRKPGPNAIEANLFGAGQEESLWRTIVKSGLAVDAASVTLFDALQENGRLKAAEASLTRESGSALAYEGWQLEAFKPVHIEMRVNYGKPQLAVMSVKRAAPTKLNVKRAPTLEIARIGSKAPSTTEAQKPATKKPGGIQRVE